MTADERLQGMTMEVVQQMQGGQEVGPAGQIHESTRSLSAKGLLTASAGEPVKAPNEFKVFETKLLLKSHLTSSLSSELPSSTKAAFAFVGD